MKKKGPNAQTIATKKYQEKIGLVPKTYKLKKRLAEDFKIACEKANVSQAKQISILMQSFIDECKKENKDNI